MANKNGISSTPGDIGPTLPDALIRNARRRILSWGRKHYRPYGWRDDPVLWRGLVVEVLLQRTKAESVVSVYNRLIRDYPDPATLGAASVEELTALIYPLGLRWRAPLLKQLGLVLEARGGTPPDTLPELMALPGVGPYVAAAYLSFHRNKRAVLIDANVVRWLCRMVDQPMDGETRRKAWLINLADRFTPARNARDYNYAILDFSMQICATKPLCSRCPVGPKLCITGKRNLNGVQS